ncbi:M23 family metallopeptidase, partial [Leptolyngbya cf. ectocarpi LEGE 11479]
DMKKSPNLVFITFVLCGILIGCSFVDGGRSSEGCSGGYPEQSRSAYILPYPVGLSFVVGQGNCTDGSHSQDQKYAYDFDMPIGTEIIASRAGVVLAVEERFADGNRTSGQENFVLVQHRDATVAGYFHLTQNGVLVEVGRGVSQGEIIGSSGDTGDSTEPHLHFEVLECQDCDSLPITFRNTRVHTNGLVEQGSYEAQVF